MRSCATQLSRVIIVASPAEGVDRFNRSLPISERNNQIVDMDAKLNIIIVGAGLGGIGAAISCALGGHNVTVLESASQIAEVCLSSHVHLHIATNKNE